MPKVSYETQRLSAFHYSICSNHINFKHCLAPILLLAILFSSQSSKAKTEYQLPVSFLENKGQIVDQYSSPRTDIDFKIFLSSNLSVSIGKAELHYQWIKSGDNRSEDSNCYQTYRMDVILDGANTNAPIIAEEKQDYYETYYSDRLPNGVTAQTYNRIVYKNIYPNIDWVLYSTNGGLKYDFIVHPGGNPHNIRMRYKGHSRIHIDEQGSLLAVTPFGSIAEQMPYAYYTNGNGSAPCTFSLNENLVSFSTVDSVKDQLVIDPAIVWSTYYGDGMYDKLNDAVATESGDIYSVGSIRNGTSAMTTTGVHQSVFSKVDDGIIVKFNASGNRLWGTYYGDADYDELNAIALDRWGNVIVTGGSSSKSGMATLGTHKSTSNSAPGIILAKFNSNGLRVWGTYYGNDKGEGYGVACDTLGNIYLTGITQSTSGIATPGTHKTIASTGVNNTFLARFDTSGQLIWGTYFGVAIANSNLYSDVAVNRLGNVFLAGTASNDINMTTPGSFQPAIAGNTDIYLARFNNNTGTLQWGTFYGAFWKEEFGGITCDTVGNVYLAGTVENGTSMTTSPSFKTNSSSWDVLLTSFTPTGIRRWATLFGGTGSETAKDVVWASPNAIYIVGKTTSVFVPNNYNIAYGPLVPQSTHAGHQEGFVAKFADDGQECAWGTYLGGTSFDQPNGVAYGGQGRVYVVGVTTSPNMATPNAHQTYLADVNTSSGAGDGFIRLYNDCIVQAIANPILGTDTVCEGIPYSFVTTAVAGATHYDWSGTPGNTTLVSASSTSATFVFSKTSSPAQVRVAARNLTCGNTGNSTKRIFIRPKPTPVITVVGSNLSTDTFNSYQWYLDNVPVAGATGNQHQAVISGNYTVEVTDSNGCRTISSGVFANGLTIGKDHQVQSITIYPNPVTDILYFRNISAGYYTIVDANGRKIQAGNFTHGKLYLEPLLPGMYGINILSMGGDSYSHKFLKE